MACIMSLVVITLNKLYREVGFYYLALGLAMGYVPLALTSFKLSNYLACGLSSGEVLLLRARAIITHVSYYLSSICLLGFVHYQNQLALATMKLDVIEFIIS